MVHRTISGCSTMELSVLIILVNVTVAQSMLVAHKIKLPVEETCARLSYPGYSTDQSMFVAHKIKLPVEETCGRLSYPGYSTDPKHACCP